ncbi:MAG: DegT/DnrJ/EryC1/StrS family aminotransferase [Dehalococcoidales bacterium]|nr:DegT/DnrJ/EryC1/StrS family aminotransferase [Dehalococcoidales bacterium]
MTDLKAQYASIKGEIDAAIQRVVESGRFILGPEVEAFEGEMAAYCGTKFAVGVASGTDASILSLIACGVKPGDEVITTPFTFIATAEAITRCGALPVFVDIDPRTYNIDPNQIEQKISSKTRAIIPVHLFGQSAEMETIVKLSKKYNLKIVEDCAQALSAEYRGKKVGSIGDAGCFSFFPAKNLGAYGDGGMVVTNDPQTAEIVRMLRQHGSKTSYYHILIGFNSRLDAIQAAILRVKLKHLDNWSRLRRQKASFYTELLGEVDGIEPPYIAEYNTTSANYYTVRIRNVDIDRNELRKYLASKDIETAVYYPLSLHLQEAYKTLSYKRGDFPESELAQGQVLSFPMFPEIEQDHVIAVVDRVKEFLTD